MLKTNRIGSLVDLYLKYFLRKVLSVGLLKTKIARLFLVAIILVAAGASTTVSYLFLKNAGFTTELMKIVFRISSISVVSWTAILFLFVKILFAKSDSFLRFTYQLPVTNRERLAALLLFEAAMVIGTTIAFFLPLSIGVAVLAGPSSIGFAVADVLVPSVITYLLLATAFNGTVWLSLRLGYVRIAHYVAIYLVACLAFAYNLSTPRGIRLITSDYLEKENTLQAPDLFGYVYSAAGWIGLVFASAIAVVALTSLMLVSTPNQYPSTFNFAHIFIPWSRSQVWPFLAALLRRTETWLTVVLCYLLAAALGIQGGNSYIYTTGFLVTQGIYAYSSTEAIRRLPRFDLSAVREVTLIMTAQALIFAVFGAPVFLIFLSISGEWITGLAVCGVCVSAILFFTLVGVLFPPDRDNPLSAFVSYSICISVIFSLAATFGIVQLPISLNIAIVVLAHILAYTYSVTAVKSARKKARFA